MRHVLGAVTNYDLVRCSCVSSSMCFVPVTDNLYREIYSWWLYTYALPRSTFYLTFLFSSYKTLCCVRFELLGALLPSTRLAFLILSMDNAASRTVFIVYIASGLPEIQRTTSNQLHIFMPLLVDFGTTWSTAVGALSEEVAPSSNLRFTKVSNLG